jgi:hypothetical protein
MSRPTSALATPASVASAASERTLARLEGDTACLVDDVVRGVVDDFPSSSRVSLRSPGTSAGQPAPRICCLTVLVDEALRY